MARPIEDVLRVLEWAKAQGADAATVGDVTVSWPERVPARAPVPNVPYTVRPLREARFTSTGRGENAAMGYIAAQRAQEEEALGLPEFRTEAGILRAEEAAERGHAPPPEHAAEGGE